MDLEKARKFFSMLLAAFGFLVLIFIIYSIFLISHYAQKKEKQEIKTGYAGELVTPSPSPTLAFPVRSK